MQELTLIMSQTGTGKLPGLDQLPPASHRRDSEAKIQLSATLLSSLQNSDTLSKAKKRKKKRTTSADTLLTPSLTAAISSEQWMEELQVMGTVFGEDMTVSNTADGFPCAVRIRLKAKEGGSCEVVVEAKWRPGYPQQPLDLSLHDSVNISSKDQQSLLHQITSLSVSSALTQSECLFPICASLLESLSLLNDQLLASKATKPIPGEVDLSSKVREDVESRHTRNEARATRPSDDDKALEEKLRDYHPDLQFTNTQSRFSDEYYNTTRIGKSKDTSVYQAIDRIEEKEYAIKRIKLTHKSGAEYRKLTKEVVQLSELYHEHIVRYYYAWTEEETEAESGSDQSSDEEETLSFMYSPVLAPRDSEGSESSSEPDTLPTYLFIKMEFCDGETLRNILDKDQLPAPMERWRLLREILDASAYMHSKGIIHKNLKPANIYLDTNSRVKIGGFGLARHHSRPDSGAESEGCYLSPETVYSEKSDLYAVGVMCYELWRQFESPGQRTEELNRLKRGELSDDFVRNAPKEVVEVVKLLTKSDPNERPNAKTILYSEYLPHKFESRLIDDFIQTILNPKTTERKWLLSALFEQQTNPAEVDFSFSISKLAAVNTETSQEDSRRKVKMESIVQSAIVNRFKAVCEKVGAIHMLAPLVSPYLDYVKVEDGKELIRVKTEIVSQTATVTYLDSTGVMVALPSRSMLPWARMIARNNPGGVIKRYSVSPIFRPRERQEPYQNLEAAFDICCEERIPQSSQPQMEAEVIKVALDCLTSIYSLPQSFEIRVSSSRLLSHLMTLMQLSKSVKTSIYRIIGEKGHKAWVNTKLQLEKAGITGNVLEKLSVFFRQQGSISDLQTYFQSLSQSKVQIEPFLSELRHLQGVIAACSDFDIPSEQVSVDLSVVSEGLLCHSGVVFEVLGSNGRVAAYGGRYDNLIQLHTSQERPTTMSGVGMRIQVNQLVNSLLRSGDTHCLTGPTVCITSHFPPSPSETHLSRLTSRMEVCALLWKDKIPAIYYYTEVSAEQAVDFCLRYNVRFLVMVKYEARNESESEDEDIKKKDNYLPKILKSTSTSATFRDFFTRKVYETDLSPEDLCRALKDALRSTN